MQPPWLHLYNSITMDPPVKPHSCSKTCGCHRFAQLRFTDFPIISTHVVDAIGNPSALLAATEAIGNDTWLGYEIGTDNHFTFGCKICKQLVDVVDMDVTARMGLSKESQVKAYRFTKHAAGPHHIDAVLRLVDPSNDSGHVKDKSVPSAGELATLIGWLRKGHAVRDGLPSVGCFRKCKKMVFCIAEGLKRLYRGWLADSCTINLLRDERHSRLLMRFRCGNLEAQRHIGIFGQPRITKSTATNITLVTIEALTRFCTKNVGAPFIDDLPASFDDALFEHIRTTLRAITVDAAGNELASAENMSSPESVVAKTKGVEAFFPSLTLVIRDKAHASRRILVRPWNCDVYLSAVASALITESSSLAQLTQHSDDLRSIYSDAVRHSGSNYVSTCFGNLRAAKHRFESMCTPLSRICLDWGASIAFLARVALERSDRAGVFASATLGAIDEELMLQAALLADAADECMCLIRFFDTREVDNAKIAGEVQRFCATISKLFFDEHVWVAEGHTKITLDFLSKTTHFVVHGIVRSVGGPRPVARVVRDRVMKRMQAWAILAQEVVIAEHPDYEVVSCFSCFDLAQWATQTVDDLIRNGRTKQYDSRLARLASTFGVCEVGLRQEFWDYGSIAVLHFESTHCTNAVAWQWALSGSSSAAARKRHPTTNLAVILAEYVCISASDSIIEHDFSRVKQLFGEHRLNSKEESESDMVMVILSDPSYDSAVFTHASVVWHELYGDVRRTAQRCTRTDKGLLRKVKTDDSPGVPSEKEWLKRRRTAVSELITTPLAKTVRKEDLGDDVWTGAHDKEMLFNAKKHEVNLYNALRSNTVKAHEVPARVCEHSDAHFGKVTKKMVARENAETKLQRVVARNMPSDAQLDGLCAWVADDLRSVKVDNVAMHLGWTFVQEAKDARVFVVENPAELSDETTFTVAMNAGWVMAPDNLVRRSGVFLKFHDVLRTRRKVFMTDSFKTDHPSISAFLEFKVQSATAWSFIKDIDAFAVAKATATRNKTAATVIALMGDDEGAVFTNVANCYNFAQFVQFVSRIDKESSTLF
jgi:hypothetical protein